MVAVTLILAFPHQRGKGIVQRLLKSIMRLPWLRQPWPFPNRNKGYNAWWRPASYVSCRLIRPPEPGPDRPLANPRRTPHGFTRTTQRRRGPCPGRTTRAGASARPVASRPFQHLHIPAPPGLSAPVVEQPVQRVGGVVPADNHTLGGMGDFRLPLPGGNCRRYAFHPLPGYRPHGRGVCRPGGPPQDCPGNPVGDGHGGARIRGGRATWRRGGHPGCNLRPGLLLHHRHAAFSHPACAPGHGGQHRPPRYGKTCGTPWR